MSTTTVQIQPHIESLNGRADGSITFRDSTGEPIHRHSGNWMSNVTRRGACKIVTDRLHPRPKRRKDEPDADYEKREQKWQRQREKTAQELEKQLLATLDRIQADAEQQAVEAAAAAQQQAAEGKKGVNGGNVGFAGDECPYVATEHGLTRLAGTPDGGSRAVPLTNFTARITADVLRDNGAERDHNFAIECKLGERVHHFVVPAKQFHGMNWPTEQMGAGAIVYAGQSARDHARVAIQVLSGPTGRTVIYTHTGWRERSEGEWVYLHADGAIGKDGAAAGIEVDLSETLGGYQLPPPPDGAELVRCVRASLGLLTLTRPEITFPVFCATVRAVLGRSDFAVWLAGGSGVFKTELATLCQQHYGRGMDRLNLPAGWASTDNALEGQAFAAKDALLVVDDFAPGGGLNEVQRLHAKADRLIRGAGNGAGRRRMRQDGTLRAQKPPRCLILGTGEELPRGHSVRGRMLNIEVQEGDIPPAELTLRQRDARDGLYAGAMSGYVRWLAARYGAVQRELRDRIDALRIEATASGLHRRTPDLIASLAIGLRYYLAFCIDCGALTKAEAGEKWRQAWDALGAAANRQAVHQQANEPAQRFIELLRSALASGTGHTTDRDGLVPINPAAWGWKAETIGTGAFAREDWTPRGTQVGWVDDDHLYLDADAAYRVAQSMASGGADGLAVTAQTIRKRLNDKGWLVKEGKRDDLFVRRKLSGATRRVLCLSASLLTSDKPAISAIPDTEAGFDPEDADPMAGSMSGYDDGGEETRHQNPPLTPAGAPGNAAAGGNGGFGGSSVDKTPTGEDWGAV